MRQPNQETLPRGGAAAWDSDAAGTVLLSDLLDAAQTAYWIAHLASGWTGTPTGAQIKAGQQSDASAATYSGSETAPGSGGGTITEATAITGATPGAAYKQAWTVYDDATMTYSNVVIDDVITASVPQIILSGGVLAFKAAPAPTDRRVFMNAGAYVARTAPATGDRVLTLAAGQLSAGAPA